MTAEPLTHIDVCLCGACESNGHQKYTQRDLTAEEIAQREIAAAAHAADLAERQAAAAALAELKASAKAKLIAGQPLTEAEAATIIL